MCLDTRVSKGWCPHTCHKFTEVQWPPRLLGQGPTMLSSAQQPPFLYGGREGSWSKIPVTGKHCGPSVAAKVLSNLLSPILTSCIAKLTVPYTHLFLCCLPAFL